MKKHHSLLLLLSVLVVLSLACRFSANQNNEKTPTSSQQPTVRQTEDKSSASPSPSTELPASTKLSPTKQPTSTPFLPTETSTPASPTDTPIVPTETVTQSIPANIKAPCGNAFANQVGVTYTYYMTYNNGERWTTTEIITETTSTYYIKNSIVLGQSIQSKSICTKDGIKNDFFRDNSMLMPKNVNLKIIKNDIQGVFLPNTDKWHIGFSWDLLINTKLSSTIKDKTIVITSNFLLHKEIVTIDKITVPAGTYPRVYKVVGIGTQTVTLANEDGSEHHSQKMKVKMIFWYVKDLGLVKSVLYSNNQLINTIELVSTK